MHQVVDTSTIDPDFARLHRVSVPAPVARGALTLLQGGIPRLASATVVLEDRFRQAVRGSVFVPHGVEAPEGTDRDEARAALGLGPNHFLVLCFGYVAPYKGLELALEAAENLAACVPPGEGGTGEVTMVIGGGVHPRLVGRDGYAEGLERRYGAVAKFTGYVPDERVHPLFSAADVVLILYPRPFSSSGALALALAHGKPILFSAPVAGLLGAPPELIAPAEAKPLAARLTELAGQPALLERVTAATAQLGSQRSWPEVARRHLQIYEEVRRGQPASSDPASKRGERA
jgi:glycosyltransferase involved in cell wall biosynthesis